MTTDHRHRLGVSAGTILLTVALTACGDSSTASQAPATNKPAASTAAGSTKAPAATQGGGSTGTIDLAALTPADKITEILGESPTPKCDKSVLTGGLSCVWTAADGSWVKVEHAATKETPTLDAFTERLTKTLGVDEPVEGLGQAAYLTTNSRGGRIAVYLGESRIAWVVINKKGDATTQKAQLKAVAERLISGL